MWNYWVIAMLSLSTCAKGSYSNLFFLLIILYSSPIRLGQDWIEFCFSYLDQGEKSDEGNIKALIICEL